MLVCELARSELKAAILLVIYGGWRWCCSIAIQLCLSLLRRHLDHLRRNDSVFGSYSASLGIWGILTDWRQLYLRRLDCCLSGRNSVAIGSRLGVLVYLLLRLCQNASGRDNRHAVCGMLYPSHD